MMIADLAVRPGSGDPATRDTLLLSRSDIAAVVDAESCIAAVEDAFRAHAEGRLLGPASLAVISDAGSFHVKAAGLPGQRGYFAAKTNANFPGNPAEHGLPTIQGVVALCDTTTGRLVAVMDSMEITIQRTAAASAVAAKYLARPDSRVVTLCGCGAQAVAQIRALARVLPLERVLAFDLNRDRARALAAELARDHALTADCAESGDLHHAIEACVMTPADVHAELGEIVVGRKRGRHSTDEITLFDSTGTALQDVAAASLAYERARATGRGRSLNFAA